MGEREAERTAAEQEILDMMVEQRGAEFVEEHAELILTQARLVGELRDEDRQ